MLNIPDEIKVEYLTDSVNKNLVIPFTDANTDVSGVNWYTGFVAYGIQATSLTPGKDVILFCNYDGTNWDTQLNDYVYQNYLDKADYIYVSAKLSISAYTDLPTKMYLAAHYTNSQGGWGGYTYWFNPNDYLTELMGDGLRIYTRIPASKVDSAFRFNQLALYCPDATTINMTYGLGDIQVESSNNLYDGSALIVHSSDVPALPYLGESIIRQGLNPLDYITIGKDPIDDITNDDVEFESFRLQENLCSSDNMKFGACESSFVNFTVYDRSENFKDREISPRISTGSVPESESVKWINWYNNSSPYPGGTSTITTSNKNANWVESFGSSISTTNLNYVSKYHWLAISFKVKLVDFTVISGNTPELMDFCVCFNAYSNIDGIVKDRIWHFTRSMFPHNYTQFALSELSDYVNCTFYIPLEGANYSQNFRINKLKYITYKYTDSNGDMYAANYGTYTTQLSYKDIQINIVSEILEELPTYNPADCLEYNGINPGIYFDFSIPLGVYTISEIKKTQTHNLTKTEITAYDKLTLLEQNAMNWYTLYMYAVDTDDYAQHYSFEFTRQIYSSYFNIMKNLGIEDRRKYTETVVQSHTDYWNDVQNAYSNNGHKDITYEVASQRWSTVKYGKYRVTNVDNKKPYVVDLGNYNNQSDADIKALALDYKQFVDAECRGLVGIANVFIVETIQTGNITTEHSFLVDSGDYFMLSPGCTYFDVYFPWIFNNELNDHEGPYRNVTGSVIISKVEKEFDLTNAACRLLYYGWQTKDIFACDSSITARDVVRSLLEVCGCFFKLDRYGMPTFLYPTMNALYPSNTLYPADDLYPRGLDGSLLSMGRYKSFEYEDYQVQNIGRIQIVKKIESNDVTSICEWEYEGDPDAVNTYLIDDNIFYCNKDLEYDYDNMDDVGQMLINMWYRISNMRYNPHLTQAIGMPWVEVGDRIGLLTVNNGIESFIYRRTLKGVQVLSDTYEAHGTEYTERVKDYNYTLWEG